MRQALGVRGLAGVTLPALLALLATLVAACAAGDKVKPVVVQPVVTAPGQKVVTVTAGQNGAVIELGLEQELVVRLATNVTSGREWSLVDLAPGVLGVLGVSGPVFERDLRTANPGEAAGTSVWRLRPMAAGAVTLRFEYRRPRKVEPVAEVVTYAVTIR